MARRGHEASIVLPLRGWSARQLAAVGLLVCMVAPAVAADDATFPSPQVRAWQTGWARPDRIQHATLSFSIGLSVGLASREPTAGLAAAMTVGLFKEFVDARRRRFDWGDVAADALGATAALAVNRVVDP